MRQLRVCLTSDLYLPHYNDGDNIVVVVDILRATSVISTAFHYGIKDVIVVRSIEEAAGYLEKENHIVAAERDAMPLKGFTYGNSPFQYMNDKIQNKTLVLTTTNGTHSISIAQDHSVITASYVNINKVYNFIKNHHKDVVILCSGWKGLVNMEDSVFAGNLSEKLLSSELFESSCDSVLASIELYKASGENLFKFLEDSSHRRRLKHLNMEDDTRFCLSPTFQSEIVPVFRNGRLVANKEY